jgi:L-glyceraldehyde 3-phosphate reductase
MMNMYNANPSRYEKMLYRRLGNSGLKLPVVSLGLWWNFGEVDDYQNSKKIILEAFNQGITHFDLANNYGPPPGSAEITFGKILKEELMPYRDEIIISTKAGYMMWPGPYGDYGSRKYLMASIDQSLERLGIPYVDIFYHHRFDAETNLEETMTALADIVRSGKALYVGLSNYRASQIQEAVKYLKAMHVPYVITQPSYNMLNRWIEADNLLDAQYEAGGGTICFVALAQGLLSNKYIDGIPSDSRLMKEHIKHINKSAVTEPLIQKLVALNEIAKKRNQTISQMAIAWVLRNPKMTSTVLGVSKVEQLYENIKAIENLSFTQDELNQIDEILKQ